MDEADDIGQRRAQLVRHVMHEIDLDLVGVFSASLRSRSARSTFTESVTSWNVTSVAPSGSGTVRAVDHAAVAAFEPVRRSLRGCRSRSRPAERLPGRMVAVQRLRGRR